MWAYLRQGEGEPYLKANTVSSKMERRVRQVCQRCNSGWMSGLEVAVAPWLTPMILGEQIAISREGQRILARWAIKTASMMHYAAQAQHEIPPARLALIKEGTSLPDDSTVCVIASESAIQPLEYEIKELNLGAAEDPSSTHGEQFTLSVGRVTIQVLSIALKQPVTLHAAPMRVQPISIWPSEQETVVWPPTDRLTDDEMVNFINRLTPSIPFPFERPLSSGSLPPALADR